MSSTTVQVERLLSDADAEAFRAQGAVVIRGLLDETWIARLRSAFNELLPGSFDPSAYDADKIPWGVDSARRSARVKVPTDLWRDAWIPKRNRV